MSTLQDLLKEELVTPDVKIKVQHVFENNLMDPDTKKIAGRTKTLGKAKSLLEFYELVSQAVDNYEKRSGVSDDKKIIFTEEEPDASSKTETVTYSLISRIPGAFGQGAPLEANVRNQRPMFREEGVDPTDPGYRQLVLGYWHDNTVRFTCWARTNKVANARAAWLENLMEEYSWWYKLQGVDRVLFLGQRADIVTEVKNNRWFGRPLDYFVRTETLRVFKEKTIEEILVNLKVSTV